MTLHSEARVCWMIINLKSSTSDSSNAMYFRLAAVDEEGGHEPAAQ
jgi:hypothetical protein